MGCDMRTVRITLQMTDGAYAKVVNRSSEKARYSFEVSNSPWFQESLACCNCGAEEPYC